MFLTFFSSSVIFHYINTKLNVVAGIHLSGRTLLSPFTEALIINKCSIAAFCVLEVELKNRVKRSTNVITYILIGISDHYFCVNRLVTYYKHIYLYVTRNKWQCTWRQWQSIKQLFIFSHNGLKIGDKRDGSLQCDWILLTTSAVISTDHIRVCRWKFYIYLYN